MLITLVIIGVVAALTIPNLMQKYQEQTTVKKVQKFYSNLSNAYSLAMKDNGLASEWGLTGRNAASAVKINAMLFKPYFKIAKDCGTNNTGNCLANVTYKVLNNNDFRNYSTHTGYYKITLDNGETVWFKSGDPASTYNIEVFFDVNGHKEPNQWGRDLFEFYIRNDKVFPNGIPSGEYGMNSFNTYCQKTSTKEYAGIGCAAWLIYKGNMDYLHCDGLKWTSRSCKEK